MRLVVSMVVVHWILLVPITTFRLFKIYYNLIIMLLYGDNLLLKDNRCRHCKYAIISVIILKANLILEYI